jgi:hypothetical protein
MSMVPTQFLTTFVMLGSSSDATGNGPVGGMLTKLSALPRYSRKCLETGGDSVVRVKGRGGCDCSTGLIGGPTENGLSSKQIYRRSVSQEEEVRQSSDVNANNFESFTALARALTRNPGWIVVLKKARGANEH